MCDLRHRLKSAADWAELHAQHGQEVYIHNYNLRSKDKHFVEGDSVIVLNDEATSKFSTRWQGPATVLRVKSPYSYLIDMSDGRVRRVHANKLHKFNSRAMLSVRVMLILIEYLFLILFHTEYYQVQWLSAVKLNI